MKYYLVLILFFLFSCSSLLKYQKTKEFKNTEFEKKVIIVEAPVVPIEVSVPQAASIPAVDKAQMPKPPKIPKPKKKAVKAAVAVLPTTRQPDIEDSEGFDNQRRPLVDPFKVGEKVIHEVSYLGATAGHLTLEVKPFAVVNGIKSYNFNIDIKSTSFFAHVYSVEDEVQTFVNFDTLVPQVFKLNIRDSGQVKEAQSYFDVENLRADYWEHRYTEKHGHEEKKLNWAILPYSQNPFSAIFYMRVFKWEIGKDYSFRVADDEKNVSFHAKAIEKEVLTTDAGTFNAIKIKAEVVTRGNLAKATDFFLWISDDDRKYILKIDVKLPIGTLVSEAVKIQEGK